MNRTLPLHLDCRLPVLVVAYTNNEPEVQIMFPVFFFVFLNSPCFCTGNLLAIKLVLGAICEYVNLPTWLGIYITFLRILVQNKEE
jgi:hypothetical protein